MSLILSLMIWTVVFAPARGHLRAEYIVLALVLLVLLALGQLQAMARVRREAVLLLLLFGASAISISVYAATGGQLIVRDLLGIVRFPVYALFLLVAAAAAPTSAHRLRPIAQTLTLLAAVSGVLSVLQYYNVGGINAGLASIYQEHGLMLGRFDELLRGSHIRRVNGTFGNPNYWGWWLVALIQLIAVRAIAERRLTLVPILALLAVSVILTGSRTAVAAMFMAGIVSAGVLAIQRRVSPRLVLSGALLAGALVMIGWFTLTTIFESGQQRTSDLGSLYLRLDLWKLRIAEWADNPIVGTGPRKARELVYDPQYRSFSDNAYLAVLTQFGLVGLTIFLALMAVQFAHVARMLRTAPVEVSWWLTGLLGLLTANAVYGLSADVLFMVPTYVLLMIFYGIGTGLAVAQSEGSGDAMASSRNPRLQGLREPSGLRGFDSEGLVQGSADQPEPW